MTKPGFKARSPWSMNDPRSSWPKVPLIRNKKLPEGREVSCKWSSAEWGGSMKTEWDGCVTHVCILFSVIWDAMLSWVRTNLATNTNKFRDLIIWHENRSLTITKLHSKQEVKKWGNLFRRKYSCHLICWCSLSICPTFLSKSLKSSRLRSISADIDMSSKECSLSSILTLCTIFC